MVFVIARTFGKLPAEVRAMTAADFIAAVAFLELVEEADRSS